ncbi:hypothetical protein AB0C34_17300 [Nocardia sp. NPDC049220]|uniref:hypothetical protein n=1 Tax=Nocardia sp. NPDC049220 TaxID=3155273 RepID=UPI0033CA4518
MSTPQLLELDTDVDETGEHRSSCLCGAPAPHSRAAGEGLATVCDDCALDTWPEHLTETAEPLTHHQFRHRR